MNSLVNKVFNLPRDHPLLSGGIMVVLVSALGFLLWKLNSDKEATRAGNRIVKKLKKVFKGLDCTPGWGGRYECPVNVSGLGNRFTMAEALDESISNFMDLLDQGQQQQKQPPATPQFQYHTTMAPQPQQYMQPPPQQQQQQQFAPASAPDQMGPMAMGGLAPAGDDGGGHGSMMMGGGGGDGHIMQQQHHQQQQGPNHPPPLPKELMPISVGKGNTGTDKLTSDTPLAYNHRVV